MPVWAFSVNHQTAPQDLRGRLAFPRDQLEATLRAMRQRASHCPETAILSTCNRTELYCAGLEQDFEPTAVWLANSGGVDAAVLRSHTMTLHGGMVARHAFRVASGLDSMVLGEPQILGQLKDAVRAAENAGALGPTLNQLFQRSFAVAKEVRTATELGAHSISMAATAVRLAGKVFRDLRSVRVLMIGAGEMTELAATHFAAKKPLKMAIANRTLERGEKLAARFGAEALRLGDLAARLYEFDVVVTSTASQLPIIGLGAVERAMTLRGYRPLVLIDLAVPRDIEPEAAAVHNVHLFGLDDLAESVRAGRSRRHAAVAQAEAIVDAGVQDFDRWLSRRHSVPVIRQLTAQAEAWRSAELARARKQLGRRDNVDEVLEVLSRRLVNKMLHGPLSALQAVDGEPQRGKRWRTPMAVQVEPRRPGV